MANEDGSEQPPPLWGLVLAGGHGDRMKEDKGSLKIHGMPQVLWTTRLVETVCPKVFVSLRAAQASETPYLGLSTIADTGDERGPARGLLSAWRLHPQVAWLAVGVDMPYLDGATLARLVRSRDPSACATTFRHTDGVLEPLCAIWEPAAFADLRARAGAGDFSLRRLLEAAEQTGITAPTPGALSSVNSREEFAAARDRFASR